jgi:hypothetical protein
VSDLEDRRDLAGLVLPEVGRLAGTGDEWVPYRLLDADGAVVVPVAEYFAELQAADSAPRPARNRRPWSRRPAVRRATVRYSRRDAAAVLGNVRPGRPEHPMI